MILLIDNYDSFVYNLARYFRELGCETRVARNDAVTVEEVRRLKPAAVVISPGPCTPREAGVSVALVRSLSSELPMLGVCLGHQAIAAAFGAEIVRAVEPVHGRTSLIEHSGSGVLEGLPSPFSATRYHSLVVNERTLPEEVAVTAWTRDLLLDEELGDVAAGSHHYFPAAAGSRRHPVPMAIAHRVYPVFGVQFHPESVLTDGGHLLLRNFLRIAGIASAVSPTSEFSIPGAVDDWTTPSGQPLHW